MSTLSRITSRLGEVGTSPAPVVKTFLADFPFKLKQVNQFKATKYTATVYTTPPFRADELKRFFKDMMFQVNKKNEDYVEWVKYLGEGSVTVTYLDAWGVLCVAIAVS